MNPKESSLTLTVVARFLIIPRPKINPKKSHAEFPSLRKLRSDERVRIS